MVWKRKKGEEFDAVNAAQELGDIQSAVPSSDEYVRSLEVEIEGLNSLMHQKSTMLARAEAQLQEGLEEIERVKRRLKIEEDQRVEKRAGEVINELLDVGDDLGRAIQAAQAMDHNPAVIEGIELVRQSFGRRLQKLGVQRIAAFATRFDPRVHAAVSMVVVTDPAQADMVLAVVQEGYTLNSKVLREARVTVGKLAK